MHTIDFYPYPLMLGLLILALMMVRQRKRGWLYLTALGFFGIYLLVVFEVIAFPIVVPENWPAFQTWEAFTIALTHNVNLIPFNYGNMFSDVAAGMLSPNTAFWEIAGNILITVPFGLGISLFSPLRGKRVLWLALAAGLALEGTQLMILLFIGPSRRAVDINDVLLNSLGVLIGYGLYCGMVWRGRQVKAAVFGAPKAS